MPYPSEHSIRLTDPGQYNRFIRKNLAPGIDAIIGFKSGSGSEIQAIRFDKTKFSVEEARAWASKHGYKNPISVEPAKKSSDHVAVADVVVRSALDEEDMASCKKIDEMVEEEDDDDDEEYWVEAFRSGTHTDSDGDTKNWTNDDIKTIAEKYNVSNDANNPERRIAPVVIGHPTHDAPAYGWIEKAKAIGGILKLKIGQLQPAFVNALKEGLYKTRSISLYPDMSIRHLGFLGAAQPAVPGLAPFKFSTEEKYDTYEFSQEEEPVDINGLKSENKFFKRLFELFKIDTKNFKGDNMADTKVVETKVEPKVAEPIVEKAEKKIEMVAAAPVVVEAVVVPPPVVPPVEVPAVNYAEEIKILKAENEQLKTELVAKKTEQVTDSYKSFVDGLVTEGRMLPRDVDQAIINMKARAELDKVNNFAETDELKSSVYQYKAYLSAMPKIMDFNEILVGKAPENKPANFVEEEIAKLRKAEPSLQYSTALDRVRAIYPDKVREYIDESYLN